MNKATIEWTVSQLPADEWMYKCTEQFARQLAIQLISDHKWITDATCIFFLFQVILDVGCGTGILSLMCAKYCQPKQV